MAARDRSRCPTAGPNHRSREPIAAAREVRSAAGAGRALPRLPSHPALAAVSLRPTVTEATPGHRLRWLGRVGIPGIFDAEHSFTITVREEGGVRLSQDERFTGVLVPLMARSLDRHTQPAFEAMNTALKQRAEQPAVA